MTALAGIGLYSPKQAERLIGVDAAKIRRWLLRDDSGHAPLWHPEPQALGAEDTLSFRDLLEVRAVAQFRQHLSLPAIREALAELRACLESDYPLTHPRLQTDGKDIFLRAFEEGGEEGLTDLRKRQIVFKDVVEPSLLGIEFDASEQPVRWQPEPQDSGIVIDPQIAFGKPIILPSYLSTRAIHNTYQAEGQDVEAVSRYFRISVDEVKRALKFENRMAMGALLH